MLSKGGVWAPAHPHCASPHLPQLWGSAVHLSHLHAQKHFLSALCLKTPSKPSPPQRGWASSSSPQAPWALAILVPICSLPHTLHHHSLKYKNKKVVKVCKPTQGRRNSTRNAHSSILPFRRLSAFAPVVLHIFLFLFLVF